MWPPCYLHSKTVTLTTVVYIFPIIIVRYHFSSLQCLPLASLPLHKLAFLPSCSSWLYEIIHLQWHNIHTKIHQNWSTGSKFEMEIHNTLITYAYLFPLWEWKDTKNRICHKTIMLACRQLKLYLVNIYLD